MGVENRWSLAGRLTGPGDEEVTTVSYLSIKQAGFGCVGVVLVLSAAANVGSSFAQDSTWRWPMDAGIQAGLTQQALRGAIGMVLVICGPMLATLGLTRTDHAAP